MSSSSPNPVVAPPHIHSLLDRLHEKSSTQEAALRDDPPEPAEFDAVMRDKFIALDQDKSQFVYQIARAIGARNIVEAGTSFGVSTIYLALAVGSNLEAAGGGEGKVIATENESTKAARAREHWQEAGELVSQYIDLREGDLRETLASNLPRVVDMMLLDIWAPMALPALKLVLPSLRPGGVVITDNTIGSAKAYADLLSYLRDPANSFTNITLPYTKGLEMSVKL